MNTPNRPSPGETIVALEKRVEATSAELDEIKGRQRIALIGVEHDKPGAQEEADALAIQVRDAKDRLQALRETIADARQAERQIADDAEGAAQDRYRKRLEREFRELRTLLKTEDAAVDEVIAADRAVRAKIERIYREVADGPTRTGELGELPRLVSTMASIINERLAHGGVLQSRSIAFDRDGPAPSVQQHFEGAVLTPIAPPPGRPKKPGGDDASASAPAPRDGDSGAAVDPAEDAARAAIEKDIAA